MSIQLDAQKYLQIESYIIYLRNNDLRLMALRDLGVKFKLFEKWPFY